jgi:hypothetical protein
MNDEDTHVDVHFVLLMGIHDGLKEEGRGELERER